MSPCRGRRVTTAATGGLLLTTVCAVIAALAIPVVGTAEDAQPRPRRTSGLLSPYERTLVSVVNAERSRRGLVRLVPSAGLTAAAEHHTRRMVRLGFFDHEAPGEPAFWNRIERFYPSGGWDYWAVGENLVYGSPGLEPDEALEEWLASPPHRRSVLSKVWREVGVSAIHTQAAPGEYENDPTTVVTLDLGVRRR